jgi:UDP-N-acetylmuramate--alanine ligase
MSLPNTHFGAERIGQMLRGCKRLLFIGVGGVSMASLAELTLMEGYEVVGSDRVESARLARLRERGAEIHLGHDALHTQGIDAAVYTVAIGEENPEYRALLGAGKPLISRADYLGYVMARYRTRIGISGMNGKSTTTAMCGHILRGAGDPTVFCGAEAEALDGAFALNLQKKII